MILPEGDYAVYLRKSRKDTEDEARTGEDTLKSHRRALFELAKRYNISITEEYPEVVSGERVSARPEMMRLLEDVENGRWKGVLVMEVERLARGDTMDQGLVAQAFRYSETLIITPMRIYNPNNPNDEEYFEFGLFMSRREFKTITRRLQWGRENAVKQGRYIGSTPPYGYDRVKLQGKGYSLIPNPDEAPIVKMIFELYTHPDPIKRMGTTSIAHYLNSLKIPSKKNTEWITATIRDIIKNPIYAGFVRWGSRREVKKKDGHTTRPLQPTEKQTIAKGYHESLIDEKTFQLANNVMKDNSRYRAPALELTNPLAGLIRCGLCNKPIIYRPYNQRNIQPQLICTNKQCHCKGSYFALVESRLLEALGEWLKNYKADWKRGKPKVSGGMVEAKEKIVKNLERELEGLQNQKHNLHDLVEQGIYTVDVFLERSQNLSRRIQETIETLERSRKEFEDEKKRLTARVEIVPNVDRVIKTYPKTKDAAKKNELLRSVLEKVTYRKEKGGRWSGEEDSFELTLYPKIPK